MLKILAHIVHGLPTCRSTAAFLLDYIEGRLSEKTARKFEAHISICPNCERYLEQYRETIRLVKDLPAPEPPPELADLTCAFLKEALDIKES
jgi:anti-sigma factor RsiW